MNEKRKPDVQGKTDLEPAKRYADKAKDHARSGRVESAAEQARRDVEGPEGEKLRAAERAGRKRAAEEDPELECVSEKLKDDERDI